MNTNEKAMRLLEQLTPLGSEFHDDPQRCFDWVRESIDSRWEYIKNKIRENRSLLKKINEYENGDDNWTKDWPNEVGDYWFYGWTYGDTDRKAKFVRVVVDQGMDCLVMVGDGQFFYESEKHIGFFKKINMPKPPILNLWEYLHEIAIEENNIFIK